MKPPLVMERLSWRLAGVVLLGVLVVAYHPESGGPVHRLLVPAAMAGATWLMVQNVVAVALGSAILAAIHSELGSDDPVQAVGYPLLAALSGAILAAALIQRFRRHIAETHEARWRHRRRRDGRPPNDPTS